MKYRTPSGHKESGAPLAVGIASEALSPRKGGHTR